MTTTNDYINWIFQTNAGRSVMSHYVALVADATGAYATVYVPGTTRGNVVEQLEDLGFEVIENQTNDYDIDDFKDPESMEEAGLCQISDLINSSKFVFN